MPGQRANTKLLTDSELAEVQRLLGLPPIAPTTTTTSSASSTPSWDGKDRAQLVNDLTEALGNRLKTDYEEAQRRAKLSTIDLAILEDAGAAAHAAVNEVFSAWTARAALTPTDQRRRKAHVFTSSGDAANLLDVADRDARELGKQPVSGWDVAMYLASVDADCKKVMATYKFNPYSGSEDERNCLSKEVLKPFFDTNQKALEECDRLGYWMASPDLGLVFAPRYVENWNLSQGFDVPPIRDRKADAYTHLIHEYIHTLQHPLIPAVTGNSHTIKEGVCEYLTTKVMAYLGEKSDEEFGDIAARVEGSWAEGMGAALRARVRRYRPASNYASAVAKVKQAITVMGGDDNGLLAAFFQGHTEYIGRSYQDEWLEGVRELPAGERTMPWPLKGTLKSIYDVARQSGLGLKTIMVDNPGLKATDLPAQIGLRGFHGHFLIVERSKDAQKNEDATENWAMIAAQHGVDARVIRDLNGNPADMPFGAWILVPDA
jgi:hypothetical protein